MNIIYDLSSGKNMPVKKPFFGYGATNDISVGALVEGPTGSEPDDLGAVKRIGTVSAPADVVGVCLHLLDISVDGEWTHDGDLTVESNRPEVEVDIRPLAVFQTQLTESPNLKIFNDADVVGTAITTDGATGAADDLVGGGFFYDDATEQLRFIEDNDGTQSWVLNTATTTAITDAQDRKTVIAPPRLYGVAANQGATLNATHTAIGIDTDETVEWLTVVDVIVELSKKQGPERLNPGIHDAASTVSARLFADIVLTDHALNVGD